MQKSKANISIHFNLFNPYKDYRNSENMPTSTIKYNTLVYFPNIQIN